MTPLSTIHFATSTLVAADLETAVDNDEHGHNPNNDDYDDKYHISWMQLNGINCTHVSDTLKPVLAF